MIFPSESMMQIKEKMENHILLLLSTMFLVMNILKTGFFGFREMDWLKTHIISIAWKKICCSAFKTVIIWMCSCVDNNSYLNLIKEQATTKFFWYYLETQYWVSLTHHYSHLLMSLPSIFYTDTCGRRLLGRWVD